MAFLRSSHKWKASVVVSVFLLVFCFLSSHCGLTSAQAQPFLSSPSPPVPTTSSRPAINVSTIDPSFFQYPATMSYLLAKPELYRTFTRLLRIPKDKALPGSYAVQIVEAAKLNITLLVPVEAAWTALGNAVSCLESTGAYSLTDNILRNHIIIGMHNATEMALNPNSYPTAGDTPVSIVSVPTGITANGANVVVPDKFMTFGGVVLNLDRVILPLDFGAQWQAACPTIPSVSPPPAVESVPAIAAPASGAAVPAPVGPELTPPVAANPVNQSVGVPSTDAGVPPTDVGASSAAVVDSNETQAPGSGARDQSSSGSSLNKDGLFSFALELLVTAALVWTAYAS
ncbi:hypothetical protein CBR_g39045 [Chara braunii]|uniref:FAS1 domain-containing protein n=1 Tax=Chara braunii TaxID=69332 RepID=A0A388LQR0_CHABU|nr:hypothetical protein CBR_g39045 [Chara braunii]|eukprot:GBG84670.1 hypothetical protein CBR_g39045 [Chara braunii]